MPAERESLELGLGLVSLGRQWGVGNVVPPNEDDAAALLHRAVALGIRTYDTAPAYGSSEERLGRFLAELPPAQRNSLIIMTKAGEHWDAKDGSRVDHSRDGLCRSIDLSLRLLGRIDVLQIHKATRDVVDSPEVRAAIAHALSAGITRFGASVADLDAARLALASGLYDLLQFPLNADNRIFLPLLLEIDAKGVTPVINRPFAMGGLLAGPASFDERAREAFGFIHDHVHSGIVLTGTGKAAHLAGNAAAFAAIRKSSADQRPLRA